MRACLLMVLRTSALLYAVYIALRAWLVDETFSITCFAVFTEQTGRAAVFCLLILILIHDFRAELLRRRYASRGTCSGMAVVPLSLNLFGCSSVSLSLWLWFLGVSVFSNSALESEERKDKFGFRGFLLLVDLACCVLLNHAASATMRGTREKI